MKNSIYLLSSTIFDVEKFHLCTWDVRNHYSFVEVGMCIKNRNDLPSQIRIILAAPFITSKCKIRSLHESFNDSDNYRFIFNEIPASINAIGEGKREGSIVRLSSPENNNQTYLMANANTKFINTGLLEIKIDKANVSVDNIYVRLLIRTNLNTIAEVIPGIAKQSYIFDIKINEVRNIPDNVSDHKRDNHLIFLKVNTAYCLHCVPDNYDIAFADASKVKNIRKLEKDAFQKYLPELKTLDGDYIIIFIKYKEGSGSYSFFTTFSKEVVGNKQLLVAIVTNLLCSLLFAIAAFRVIKNENKEWYLQIPIEWWIAGGLVLFGALICLPICSIIKQCWNAHKDN